MQERVHFTYQKDIFPVYFPQRAHSWDYGFQSNSFSPYPFQYIVYYLLLLTVCTVCVSIKNSYLDT